MVVPASLAARLSRALPAALAVISLGSALWASRVTAPAFRELSRLGSVDAAAAVVARLAERGLGSLTTTATGAELARLEHGTLLSLLAGWSKLSIARVGLLDPLTAMRLPWLVIAALGPCALYGLVAARRGPWVGALAAAALMGLPHWLHGVAVAERGIVLTSIALVAAWLADRARRGRRRVLAGVGVAAVIGAGLAETHQVLWVLPWLVAHQLWVERRWLRRSLRRGRVAVPAWLLLTLPLAPLLWIALDPALWTAGPVGIARDGLQSLAPRVEPTHYAGTVVLAPPVPGAYGPLRVLSNTPLWVLGLAVAGAMATLRRRAPVPPGASRPGSALGLLALGVLWPTVAPNVLLDFPPLVALTQPLFACGVALAVAELWAKVPRFGPALGAVALLGVWVPTLVGLPSAGAARSALPASLHARFLPDGSEVGVLARDIDSLGRTELSLAAPDVPANYFAYLERTGRMRTAVVLAAGADATLARGAQPDATFTVTRRGQPLWSLTAR